MVAKLINPTLENQFLNNIICYVASAAAGIKPRFVYFCRAEYRCLLYCC